MNYVHDRRTNLALRALIDRLESTMQATVAECRANVRAIREAQQAADKADTVRRD